MCGCRVTPGRMQRDRGGAARRDVCPCLSFPTCKRGVTGAAGPGDAAAAPLWGRPRVPLPGAPGPLPLVNPSTESWARTRRARMEQN